MADGVLGASFRDPAGFLFTLDGVLYRQVNRVYAPHYERLMASGLHRDLVDRGLLIPHAEATEVAPHSGDAWRVLRPEPLARITYPYEWCFGQLREAAQLVLEVQRAALRHGMTLKDASAFNVQLHRGRPIWIDTLSFEIRREGAPWVAYRQFCQHFLAPLALRAHVDPRLGSLAQLHLDGVPLDLATSLLRGRARLDPHLWIHLRLHARLQRRHADRPEAAARARPLGERAQEGLVAALEAAVRRQRWRRPASAWSEYVGGDSYAPEAAEARRACIAAWLERARPGSLLDLGTNTGEMGRLASARGVDTVGVDADPACIELGWRAARDADDRRYLPLVVDLANPSPALGFAHDERDPFERRFASDAVLALAVVHHLALANNVPLPRLARWLARLGRELWIEFVPKSDPKARRLLAAREDVFPDYAQAGFERAFAACFELCEAVPLPGSERRLYRMRRRDPALTER